MVPNHFHCVNNFLQEGKDIDQEKNQTGGDFGLCAAQIVITAATPMIEEAEHPFPGSEDGTTNHTDEPDCNSEPEETSEDHKEPKERKDPEPTRTVDIADDVDDPNDDGGPQLIASSSTGSDGETTGPSTAENSISQVPPLEYEPKQIVGGRASIPEELEPDQLARLKDLKESNAQ